MNPTTVRSKTRILFLGYLFFGWFAVKAQTHIELKGRVYHPEVNVAGIHIINRNAMKATITDAKGLFNIRAKQGDTLHFTAVQFKPKKVVVTEAILKERSLSIFMAEVVTELSEVVVTPYRLSGNIVEDLRNMKIGPEPDATSLGLMNEKTRRKPRGFFKKIQLTKYATLFIGFDTVTFKPQIDLITDLVKIYDDASGDTKRQKQYDDIEKKVVLNMQLRREFTDKAFGEELKIRQEKISDFLIYCSIDVRFDELISAGDRLKLWEWMREKSATYRTDSYGIGE